MFAAVAPRARAALIMSAAAGMIIAIWLTAQLVGWDEDRVLTWIPDSRVLAAVVVVGLLVADTVLPIPATIVMLTSGVLFGPVVGATLNTVGLLVAAIAGYGLGRALPNPPDSKHAEQVPEGGPPGEQRSMRFVWIAMTRGVPVLSESYAIGAGVLGFPLRHFVSASLLGAVAVGSVYAVAGWLSNDHWLLIVVAAGLAAGGFLSATCIVRGGARHTAGGPRRDLCDLETDE